jgi:carbonic anhydrase
MADEEVSEKPRTNQDRLENLLENNREWAKAIKAQDPTFFERLATQQSPKYLWIGCSDSRVPATTLIGLDPGEVHVHRNIANLVLHTDLNALSVLHKAIEILKVKHIIVCGHHGCGGVAAALDDKYLGLIDNWLGAIKDVYHLHKEEVDAMPDQEAKVNRLCELNVMAQAARVATIPVVQQAWERGQELTIHAWVYSIKDVSSRDQLNRHFLVLSLFYVVGRTHGPLFVHVGSHPGSGLRHQWPACS